MAELTLTMAASADDAYLNDAAFNSNAVEMIVGGVGTSPATNHGQGWRFTNVTIEPGSTISRVVLKLMKSTTQFAIQDNRWTFEAADNAATFSSGSPPGSRAIVGTIVGESNNVNETADTVYNFPRTTGNQDALAAALQAVIDRAGWASGNAVALINNSYQDASAIKTFARKLWHSYDSTTASSEPQLVITYEPPAEPPADATIWNLTDELTDAVLADLLVAVDDVAGTPTSKKLTLASFAAALAVTDVVRQVFTSGSGTYTPTARMKAVLVIAVGGGGTGAGGVNTDSAGGGGGGAGTCIKLFTAATIGASQPYAVGAAGAATTLGTAGALLNAGAGGDGTAGAASSGVVGVMAAGGLGGSATGGDLNIPGTPGKPGVIYSGTAGVGGKGGSSVFGHGGPANGTNVAGSVGTGYGAGGSGGHASGTANRDGAAGSGGCLFFLEFLG